MCGIAGIVSFSGDRHDNSVAAALGAALAHRGPDGEGTFASTGVLLVHRRLAIIDPSPAAAQPMSTADGRYQLVFNGEVYNHRELRRELESAGETFRTQSDTEVLLRLLVREGPAALARVRGMFALALWDERGRTLLVARDRFGIKPLYLASDGKQVAFASEIGALRRSGLVSRDISPAAVLAYLSWASIPAPLTWLREVTALAPGTWSRWNATGVATHGAFADAAEAYVDGPVIPERELRMRAASALRDSIRAHLVADVPVGVFLSGGIDSGAIVSAARDVAGAPLNSYTVIVDEASHCEGPYAARVAAAFGTEHHELRVDARTIASDLSAIVACLDQPTGDAVNSYYVSRAVASTGVKAVLSGVGGDELFGGYPSFERVPSMLHMSGALGPVMRATGPAAAVALPAWRAAKWQHFARDPRLEAAYRTLRGFFMPSEWAAIAGPALADAPDAAQTLEAIECTLFAAAGPESQPAAVARLETRGFLRSQLLRDIDAMSMAHGLEVRVPFVDHELQQAIWPALGHHPRLLKGKRLLHESLTYPLPSGIVSRPKRGFTLPFESWMRGELRESTRDGLDALACQRWLHPTAPDTIWRAFESGQAHWSRAWGLGILGRFLQEAP
jgi:asparagine synthase (glutamine-hydrolysing)